MVNENDEDPRAARVLRRLEGPLGAASTARAREQVWARLTARHEGSRRPWLVGAVVVATAVALVLGGAWLGSYRVEVASGGLPILYQERIAATIIDGADVNGSVVIEQRHLHDAARLSVVATVDLRIDARAVPATIDIFYRPAGTVIAGSLAHEPEVSEVRPELGSAPYNVSATFPPLERGEVRIYDVWVRVETAKGSAESARLRIEVRGAAEGQRARLVGPP